MRCLYFREGMEQWIEIENEVSGSGSGPLDKASDYKSGDYRFESR